MDATEVAKLASLEDRHWWYAARRRMLARAVEPLTAGRAVDIGAGAGGNSRVLNAAGWRTTAVEMSATGASLASQRNLETVRADATRLPFPDTIFDLAVAMDIWEHVGDDIRAASEAFRVLRPGGHLYVTVPCDMELWSAHDVAVDHVRRYERAELIALVENAGFRVDAVSSWLVLLRPAVKWRRGGKDAPESDLSEVPRLMNSALRAAVIIERHLNIGHRRGVSLILRARRPV